jgi:hypothetical protein
MKKSNKFSPEVRERAIHIGALIPVSNFCGVSFSKAKRFEQFGILHIAIVLRPEIRPSPTRPMPLPL